MTEPQPHEEPSPQPSSENLYSLSPKQLIAIEQRLAGKSQAEAAETAEVSRETVCRWERHHPAVITEMNRRRLELRNATADRMRQIDELALNTVAEQMANGDAKASFEWLKMRGTHRIASEPVGPTDPDEIIEARIEQRMDWARKAMPYADRLYHSPGLREDFRDAVVEDMRRDAGLAPTPPPPPLRPPAWSVRVFSATTETASGVGAEGPDLEQVPNQLEVPPLGVSDFDTLLELATDGKWSSDDHPFKPDSVTATKQFTVTPLRPPLRSTLAKL